MSVLPTQTNINPANAFFYGPSGLPQLYTSTFVFGTTAPLTSGSLNYSTITVPGMLSTSGVALTYEHPGGGGAGQFVANIQPGTNSLSVTFGQVSAAGESFNLISVNPR